MRCIPLTLVALAACQSPLPRLAPLKLQDPFAVAYSGEASPATPMASEPAPPSQPKPTAIDLSAKPALQLKATTVELDVEGARQLFASLREGDPAHGSSTRSQSAPAAQSAAMPLAALAGAHIEAGAVESLLEQLRGRANVLASPRVIVMLGEEAKVAVSEQRSVVCALDLKAMDEAILADPRVGVIEYGDELVVRATQDKEQPTLTRLHLQWRVSRPTLPVPVVQTSAGAILAPVLVRHELVASPPLADRDFLAFASLPSGSPKTVLVLFVETKLLAPTKDTAQQ